MDLPQIKPYDKLALEEVTEVLQIFIDRFGTHQSLHLIGEPECSTSLVARSEKIIADCIEDKWKLTKIFQYHLRYLRSSTDETTVYFYFEAIFSQPTPAYPIPQVTASVFFRVQDNKLYRGEPEQNYVPQIIFRIEGHYQDHDILFVTLTPDAILEVLMMKLRLFERIENEGHC